MKRSKNATAALAAVVPVTKPLKLDLGAGKTRCGPDWTTVDVKPFEGVDIVADLTRPWPWGDDEVDEVNASHVLEHFDAMDRVHFVNELHRVLKPGGKAQIVTPHWNSNRAYGDMTHKWPPVSEFFFYYLSAEWRAANAPHNDFYTCNFAATWGYALRQDLLSRNQEYQQFAMQNFREACQDTVCTLIKT